MRRGLAREDLCAVGIELTMTESMTHCDVVLPAATHFEYADLYPLGWTAPRHLVPKFGRRNPNWRPSMTEITRIAIGHVQVGVYIAWG